MKAGQISDLIQIDNFYTILRLNAHNAAGMKSFDEVKDSVRKDIGDPEDRSSCAAPWTRSCAPTPRWKSCKGGRSSAGWIARYVPFKSPARTTWVIRKFFGLRRIVASQSPQGVTLP